MSVEEQARLESEALNGLLPGERWLLGPSIKRNVRNEKSRFYTWLPKYGPMGSATLLAANLWVLPGFFFLIPAVALTIPSRTSSLTQLVSHVLFGLCLASGAMMIIESRRGASLGKKYRAGLRN